MTRGDDDSANAPRNLSQALPPADRPRPAPPPARTRRIAETVAASRRVLEADGPGALTMRRLADELGIRAPSLYKHFSGKADVELALIGDAMFDIGDVTHRAIHNPGSESPLMNLLTVSRQYCVSHPNLYRLATSGRIPRGSLPPGL